MNPAMPATKTGFLTDLVVRLVDDTANQGRGEWVLVQPLVYRAQDYSLISVPIGFVTDFASVPRAPLAFLVAGDRAHRAAVIHDYLIRMALVERRVADDYFLEAMRATGVPEAIAQSMHLAVRSYSESLLPPGREGRGHEFV